MAQSMCVYLLSPEQTFWKWSVGFWNCISPKKHMEIFVIAIENFYYYIDSIQLLLNFDCIELPIEILRVNVFLSNIKFFFNEN